MQKESSKLLEKNLKIFASEEKSIGRISNSYKDFKDSQLEAINIAKAADGLKEKEQQQITGILSLSRDLSELLTAEDTVQVQAKTTELSNRISKSF